MADSADGVCGLSQPITGESADAIAKECPGLFEVEGKGRHKKASVNPAREHTQLLEKVLLHMTITCWQAVTLAHLFYMLLYVGLVHESLPWLCCCVESVCLHSGILAAAAYAAACRFWLSSI